MQEKKNKRLLALLVALICVTGVTLWLKQGDRKAVVAKDLFNHYDLQTINEVRLESSKSKVTLTYNGTRWKVNNEFSADPAMIEVLFATIQQAVPKRPVALAAQDSLTKVLRNDGVKVSVLADGKVIQTFYAGGNDAKSQAYFVADDATPYLMTIPGYRVYVSGIFELTLTGWRDKRIFTLNWRNFDHLQASFPGRPADDFRIALVDQFVSIQGMNDVDTTQINTFMDNLLSLAADEFPEDTVRLDTLKKVQPLMSVEIRDVAGKVNKLVLYPPSRKTPFMVGLVDNKQWALFARERVAPIIRPRKTFQTKATF